MRHPFDLDLAELEAVQANLQGLTDAELETVAGGKGYTTMALGEEGGHTTMALGEEGGGPTTMALGEEGGYTTLALAEGGGAF
jgi:hypothetical protein